MNKTQEALKMAIEFIDEITNAAGKYPYVNKTSLVVDSYAMASKLKETLAQPAQEVECSNHPDAPHGFCRDASHSAGRYVCECEGWEVEQAAQETVISNEQYQDLLYEYCKLKAAAISHPAPAPAQDSEQAPCEQPVAWATEWEDGEWSVSHSPNMGKQSIPLYTHPAPSWQGLSDKDLKGRVGSWVDGALWAEKLLKEKNHVN